MQWSRAFLIANVVLLLMFFHVHGSGDDDREQGKCEICNRINCDEIAKTEDEQLVCVRKVSVGDCTAKKAVTTVLGAGLGLVAAVYGIPFALAGVGFGAGGVTAGSLAAWAQSMIGSGTAAASAFGAMQSAGAAGIGLLTKAGLAAKGGMISLGMIGCDEVYVTQCC